MHLTRLRRIPPLRPRRPRHAAFDALVLAAATLAFVCTLLGPRRALGHPLRPASLTLIESEAGRYQLRFRRPERLKQVLTLVLPSGCRLGAARTSQDADQTVDTTYLTCARSLEGLALGFSGLQQAAIDAIVHVQHGSGETARALLTAERPSFTVPARTSSASVLAAYAKLGAQHLVEGLDHVLFAAGLLLLNTGRSAAWLLTAFTLGHSVTLALLARSGASLAQGPVELGIALTLIGLALTMLARARAGAEPPSLTGENHGALRPAALCFAVGLLHGLGFADGLKELGLPTHALLPALLGFNVGIELAQLGLLGALAPALWLATRHGPAAVKRLRIVAAYGTGGMAAMWCIERTLSWLE